MGDSWILSGSSGGGGGGSAEIFEAECQAADEWVPGRARFIYPSKIVFPMGPPIILGSVAVWCGGTVVL